jgi:hypothetical protein
VNVVQVKFAANVVVPAPLLIINGPSVVLVFGVIVPVPTIVAVKLVNVPPLDNVNEFKFNDVAVRLVTAVPLKFNVLNQLPVVNVNTYSKISQNSANNATTISNNAPYNANLANITFLLNNTSGTSISPLQLYYNSVTANAVNSVNNNNNNTTSDMINMPINPL